MEYQPPSFLKPRQYDIPGSIDSIFNAYQQAKQMQDQNSRQDFQDVMNYGTPTRGLSTDQLMRGAQGPTVTPAVPAGFNAPGTMVGSPTPAQPEQTTFDMDPHVAAIQRAIQLKRQSQAVGAQEAQATLGKTNAEANKLNTEADMNRTFQGSGPGSVQDWAKTTADSVRKGLVAPSQAQTEATRVGPNGMGRMALDKELAGIDLAQAEANFKGKESKATLENSAAIQVPARLQKSLMPSFDYLDTISQKADKSQYQLINKYGIALAAQKGDRLAQHLQDVSNAISEEFAANLGGTGSDAKLHLGMSLFDKAKTGDQIHDAVTFMRHNAVNRSEAYLGKEPSAIPVPPQFGGPAAGGDASSYLKSLGLAK